MPKIPIYKQRVGYVVPTVQTVQTARPVAKIPSGRAVRLGALGEAMTLAGSLGEAFGLATPGGLGADKRARTVPSSKEVWQALEPSSPQSLFLNKKSSSLEKQGLFLTEPNLSLAEPLQREKSDALDTHIASTMEQASTERIILHRREMLAAAQVKNVKTPVENLDDYASKVWMEKMTVPSAKPQAELFAQDYAVLRRELAQSQAGQIQENQKKTEEQDADLCAKMASLIKTPQALEMYVEQNAQRIGLSAQQSGGDGKAVARQVKQEAVCRNIETALSCEDEASAHAVYQAFNAQLPATVRAKLEPKLRAALAQKQGYVWWMNAQKELEDPSPRAVRRFAQAQMDHLAETEKASGAKKAALDTAAGSVDKKEQRTQAASYAELFSRRAQQENALLESESCRVLRLAQDFPSARRALQSGSFANEADFKRKEAALVRLFTLPNQQSHAPSFNRLYQKMTQGALDEKELSDFFEGGKINGGDYLLLKENQAALQAGKTNPDGKFVQLAAERFCHKKGLSAQEAERVKYRVFSTPGTAEEQLKTLRRIKEILAD